MKPSLRIVSPSTENVTVSPRKPNKEYRTREYLVPDEVERLVKSLQGQSIAIRP